jgi:hypothetical protein
LKKQVWEEGSRGQVLQVEAFKPYEEIAAGEVGPAGQPAPPALEAQMLRLQVQRHAYLELQQVLPHAHL